MLDAQNAGCLAVAVALAIAGTLATGILPPTPAAQAVAGGLIVVGFALLLICFRR